MADIVTRTEDHLNIVLSGAAAGKPGAAGLDGVRFEHVALPEIDPFPQFLGYDLSAPLMVSSTTGGVVRASQISADLAQAGGRADLCGGGHYAFEGMIGASRVACFCTGSRNLAALKQARLWQPSGPAGRLDGET